MALIVLRRRAGAVLVAVAVGGVIVVAAAAIGRPRRVGAAGVSGVFAGVSVSATGADTVTVEVTGGSAWVASPAISPSGRLGGR